MVESKEKCKREDKRLTATIEKGMPDAEEIVFKYESEHENAHDGASASPQV